MTFTRTEIPDVIICEPQVFGDERGYFVETFRADKFSDFLGKRVNFCQDNESKSGFGVLRGLHFQLPPFAQSKLVRVIQGRVLDVAVDIRRGSPTFAQYVAVELSGENKKQLFIPRGFAHGFVVLEEETIFAYKVDSYYDKASDSGLAFNDADIGIDWKITSEQMRLSDKDKEQPTLLEALEQKSKLFEYDVDYYA